MRDPVQLTLIRNGDHLRGIAMARPMLDESDPRFGNGYSHWCELERSV